ncbi:hypothetical protein [Streptomyces sp. NPDC052107]|uniref:hypothetical protein n=1 Tax=Streptomyces sp. NPDC052107 TaxID=3155632 RepID=UPI003420AA29
MTSAYRPVALTPVEEDLMVSAMESWGILAYAADGDPVGLAEAVLCLVDRGWVQVHRIEPWTAPDGEEGAAYGEPLPRADLPAILRSPATWDDPEHPHWYGAVTLSVTDAWRTLNRR